MGNDFLKDYNEFCGDGPIASMKIAAVQCNLNFYANNP